MLIWSQAMNPIPCQSYPTILIQILKKSSIWIFFRQPAGFSVTDLDIDEQEQGQMICQILSLAKDYILLSFISIKFMKMYLKGSKNKAYKNIFQWPWT